MNCPRCGHGNPTDAAFCGECGLQLAAPPPPAPKTGTGTGIGTGTGTGSEATRYLCAGAQMDERFASLLVDNILRQEHRSIASSPDVDLVAVLKHAVSGNSRRGVRDAVLFGVLAFLVVLAATGQLLVALPVCYLIALAVVVVEVLVTRHEVLAGTLSRSAFRPEEAPDPSAHWQPALRRVAAHGTGNVTVYSGFSPFVGYGGVLDSWSFALDVTTPAPGREEVRPFTAQEIHDHVAARVVELALPGLEVTDRLFVNGRDIRDDRRFLPDPTARPVVAVDGTLVGQLLAAPEDRARPYLMVRVVGWQGELALSVFCRFLLVESYLFVEASYSLLTPVREAYKSVDGLLPTPTFGEVVRTVRASLLPAVTRTVASPRPILTALFSPLVDHVRRSRIRRHIERNPLFDYGALVSAREAAGDNAYQRYFQRLDSELYRKVVERRILDALVEFVDDHGIDPADLVERQTTILNQGVLVTGGTLSAQNVAVGRGAQAGTAGGDGAARRGLARIGVGRETRK